MLRIKMVCEADIWSNKLLDKDGSQGVWYRPLNFLCKIERISLNSCLPSPVFTKMSTLRLHFMEIFFWKETFKNYYKGRNLTGFHSHCELLFPSFIVRVIFAIIMQCMTSTKNLVSWLWSVIETLSINICTETSTIFLLGNLLIVWWGNNI